MLKKVLIFSFNILLPSLSYADDYPPPPDEPLFFPGTPLSYNRKPDNALYLSSQEQKNILNGWIFKANIDKKYKSYNSLFQNSPNYSIDLGENKKEKILQSVKDVIDDKKNFYQAFHIKYTLKYSEQCPVGYKVSGEFEKNICHDTYEQYLQKKELYRKTNKNFPGLLYRRTFWHDAKYYVPDGRYVTNGFNDIILDKNGFFINFNKICIKDNDIISFFKINPQDVMDEDNQYHFHIDYHNENINFFKNKFVKNKDGCLEYISKINDFSNQNDDILNNSNFNFNFLE